ncbi:MAG: hypothetical protein ACK55I_02500, partial [bacterium]
MVEQFDPVKNILQGVRRGDGPKALWCRWQTTTGQGRKDGARSGVAKLNNAEALQGGSRWSDHPMPATGNAS